MFERVNSPSGRRIAYISQVRHLLNEIERLTRRPMTQLPNGLPFSLVPLTDKVSREPADHPDRIPVDRRADPITRRLRVLVRRSLTDRPN
jgi:hypothetical protein